MIQLVIILFILSVVGIVALIYNKIERYESLQLDGDMDYGNYFDRKHSTERGLKYSDSDYDRVKQRRATGQIGTHDEA